MSRRFEFWICRQPMACLHPGIRANSCKGGNFDLCPIDCFLRANLSFANDRRVVVDPAIV